MDTVSKTIEHSWFLDLPKTRSVPGISDLPEEIVNEIILLVPLIDLFRVSKVCHQFKILAYKRRVVLNTRSKCKKAIDDGDILSLLSVDYFSDKYWQRACFTGYMEIIHYMMFGNIMNWNLGLCVGCRTGNIELVQLMLEKDSNSYNYGVCTEALMEACQQGNMDIVQLIIHKIEQGILGKSKHIIKANIWNSGLTAACKGGHMSIVQLMIEKVESDKSDSTGKSREPGTQSVLGKTKSFLGAYAWNSALPHACTGGNMSIVQLIINKAEMEFSFTDSDWLSAITAACERIFIIDQEPDKINTLEIIKLLISKAESLFRINEWISILCSACYAGDMYLIESTTSKIEFCLAEGQRSDFKTYWNDVLYVTCQSPFLSEDNALEIVHLLINKGANNWNDCLYYACRKGRRNIAQLMIEKVESDLSDSTGETKSLFGGK